MADKTSIAGVSIASIAAIMSLCCFIWLMLHLGTKYEWWGSSWYGQYRAFQGGEIF